MIFSSDIRPCGVAQDVRPSARRTVCPCLFNENRKKFFLIASVVAFLLNVVRVDVGIAFAQTSAHAIRTQNVATPEEATGTTVRDFDALRALDRNYLNNPDNGETPIDEDDLWFPEMALAKKPETANSSSVRMITYEGGKTKTQTNAVSSPQNNDKRTQSKSSSRQSGTRNAIPQATPNVVATAQYNAAPNAPNGIKQTSGAAEYRPNEGYLAPYQGLAEYPIDEADLVENMIPQQESTTPTNIVSAAAPIAHDEFPTATPFLGDVPANVDVSPSDSSVESIQPRTTSEATLPYAQTPNINSGLDALLSNTETSSTAANIDSNANGADAPLTTTDDASFPETNFPILNSPLPEQESNATPNNVEVPLLASRPTEEVVIGADSDYKPIDLLAEPEIDHTVVNGIDEPFRESYRVTPQGHNTKPTDEERVEKNRPQEQSLESASLSEADLKNLTIADVRISGLEMTAQQFNKIVKTRIGAKFNQQRLEEDKRALLQTKQFIDVAVSTSWSPDAPDQVVVNFDLTPRRMMRYVKVVGNRKISKHDILEELALRPGESRMDPYEVENGRLRIIEFYKSKDYGEPHVEILRGDHPEDVGVVYLIDEGLKQRVLSTKFVGNSVVSSARLHSLVSTKPGVFYILGGAFTRERLDADVEKLLEYYRNLGYFDARIDREYEESKWFGGLGKDNAWVSVRYIIDEGPRYKIRNFTFNGNRVVSDAELEKELKVKKGSYYRFDEVEADRIALRYKYQDLGYVRADVTPNQIFTDEVGVVDIRYDINEDHRYRVSDVVVDYVGSESRTMTPVVLNMLDVKPGELLNGKKIRMSENTLRQSGYFNDKPTDGQLPEIAVVPDETKIYRLNKEGKAEVVHDSAKDKNTTEKNARHVEETTRGQSPKTQAVGAQETVARGQSPVTETKRAGAYVPYEETKRQKNLSNVVSTNSLKVAPEYRSVAPNLDDATTLQPNTVVTPRRGVATQGSLVRGQTRQVPSGFSPTTTRETQASSGSYRPYDSTNLGSQFTDGLDYANGESANLLNSNASIDYNQSPSPRPVLSTDESSTPGFSDGVYGSIGKEILEPITPDEDEIYDGTVLVKVQEGRTGMFQASIGVNSDYGLVGNVSFTERNFNLFRPPTDLFRADGWNNAFRGGGQIFSIQASPGTSVQSYRASWDVPNVFNSKFLFGVTGLYGEHSFDEWFEARYGGEVRLGRQWTPRFSTTLNGGIYNVKIKDPAVPFVPDLNKVVGTNRMYNVGLTAAYDTRNHPYSPSAGFLLKGTGEVGLGDYNFPRVTLDGRYYKTLHKRVDGTGRWVLGLSSHLGWTGDNTPIYERYYGGGSQNLRGFEYREVTPRYLQTGFGVGGKFEFYNTVEFFVPVSGGDEFQLAFFVDTGTVAESMKKWGRYRVAPGFGLRFQIPMLGPAPLALDFAFPVCKDPNDVTEVFTFNLSGSR